MEPEGKGLETAGEGEGEGDYIVISEVGRGSFSTVSKAVHRQSGQVVALKQVHLSRLNRHLKTCLDCEINFLSSVNHPNIIRLLNSFQDEGCVFMVLEFCDGGNLAAYIRRHGRVEEHIAKRFMQQLGAALEILHSHHIIHRDLKPENILLSGTQDDVVLKVADFGLSRSLHPGDYAETVCGSPLYMAPEVLQFERYDGKVDMWSVGVILFELLNGRPPFPGRTNVQVLKTIKSSTYIPSFRPSHPFWIASRLRRYVFKTVVSKSSQAPVLRRILFAQVFSRLLRRIEMRKHLPEHKCCSTLYIK